MYLIEAEGKQMLKEAGMDVPGFFLLPNGAEPPANISYPVIVKAQTVTGGRGKSGLVRQAADGEEFAIAMQRLLKERKKRGFEQVLVEPRISAHREYYVSITFDDRARQAILVVSRFGGMDIEAVAKRQPQSVGEFPINPLHGFEGFDWDAVYAKLGLKEELHAAFQKCVLALYDVFTKKDALLVEVNPLMEEIEGTKLIAVDCKVVLDDAALYRHDFSFPRRTGERALTPMELEARAIDERSHRGVVGRSFLELDGDIAFMSSGGGASITCLDALISYGGRPANFVEYSGNPERDDVYALTKLILSKKGLRGLWIVGPTANFTDVYETLAGIMQALVEEKPAFPIVIRRAGPRDKEAKEMVEAAAKEHRLDIAFYGEDISMTESVKMLMDKIGGQE